MIILHVLFNSEFVYLNIMLQPIFIKEISKFIVQNPWYRKMYEMDYFIIKSNIKRNMFISICILISK